MILLAQSHDLSRYASAELLRDAGYEVLEAANADESLALLEQHPFKLLIADAPAPHLTSVSFARRVRLRWPDMPMILVRNILESPADPGLRQPVKFLEMPIDAGELKAAVHRFLPPSA